MNGTKANRKHKVFVVITRSLNHLLAEGSASQGIGRDRCFKMMIASPICALFNLIKRRFCRLDESSPNTAKNKRDASRVIPTLSAKDHGFL